MQISLSLTDQRLVGGDFPNLSGVLSVQNETDYTFQNFFITVEFRSGSFKCGYIIESTDHLAAREMRSWIINASPMDSLPYDSCYATWQGTSFDEFGNILSEVFIPVNMKYWTYAEPPKSGCYVVTACTGSEDNITVNYFRNYRDTVLIRTPTGRVLIRLYERIGPFLAHVIKNAGPLRTISYKILSSIAKSGKSGGI